MEKLTMSELRRLLVANAGEVDDVELDESMMDEDFATIGYDSLALMETLAAISQQYGADVPDHAISEVNTPRQLLELVNSALPTA